MTLIRLRFQNHEGHFLDDLELSDDVPLNKLWPHIQIALRENFPEISVHAAWQLIEAGQRRPLSGETSLREAGLHDGSVLIIQPQHHFSRRYLLKQKIGEGGMGEVYEAYDQNLERTVAIKFVKQAEVNNAAFIERLAREARAISRLAEEKNIATVYDFVEGDEQSAAYIVMEFVEGPTLADLIAARNALPIEQVSEILAGIASALDAAHANGLIHRDIKASNVLLQPDKVKPGHFISKLVDFGLVRMKEEASSLTRTGTLVGSVHYMSPEQIEGASLTPQSDVYSLGVVVYEMLTGRRPFQDDSEGKILAGHLKEIPRSLNEVRRDLPKSLSDVVLKALEKDPKDRYDTAVDFANAVQRNLDISAGRNGNVFRDKRFVVSGSVLILVLIAGISFFFLNQVNKRSISSSHSFLAAGENIIIFDSNRNGQWQVHAMLADGSSQRPLLSEDIVAYSPSLSPDGQKLAYVKSQGDNQEIFIMDLESREEYQLTHSEFDSTYPTFSPDGNLIAFDSNRAGNWGIYLSDLRGSNISRLTTDSADERYADWSPDQQYIVFSSNRAGNWDIYAMDIEGGEVLQLTTDIANDRYPAWSPDGESIAFASQRNGHWDIYVMSVLGTAETRLSTHEANDLLPVWAPNGEQLLFYSNRSDNDDIYIMNADGSGKIRLTTSLGDDRYPLWIQTSD